MLRSEILAAGNNVLSAIDRSGIREVVEEIVHRHSSNNVGVELISAFRRFDVLAAKFGDAEHQIIENFELSFLLEDKYWMQILGREEDSASIHSAYFAIRQLTEFLPKFLRMLVRDTEQGGQNQGGTEKPSSGIRAPGQISIILPEEEGHLSSPKRVIILMEATEGLYEAAAILDGLPASDLAVAACDSGSDKIFDFTGISRIIDAVRTMLLEAYHCTIFWREKQYLERIKLVSETLPVLSRIKNMEDSNQSDEGKAELLRRQITESISKFLQTGGRTPEMNEQSHFEPTALLKPTPQLLLPPPEEPQGSAGPGKLPRRQSKPRRRRKPLAKRNRVNSEKLS